MKASEQRRFDSLYQRHLRALKLQGLSEKTIDVLRPCGTPGSPVLRLLSG